MTLIISQSITARITDDDVIVVDGVVCIGTEKLYETI